MLKQAVSIALTKVEQKIIVLFNVLTFSWTIPKLISEVLALNFYMFYSQ